MVITIHIDRWDVTRILIDNGSKAEILFLAAVDKMGFDKKSSKNRQSSYMASVGKESNQSGSSPYQCLLVPQ
jgi:hypothetical protein